MIAASLDLFEQRWELARFAAVILQPTLLIALAAGLVLASAHLLTMLGTRWGRRRVSQKALLFSIVVHFSIVCGILALWPEAVPGGPGTLAWTPQAAPAPPPDAFRILPESDLAVVSPSAPAARSAAVWNQLPDDLVQQPERREVEPPPPVVDTPEPRPAALPLPEMEIAVTTPLPAPEATLPEPVETPDVAPDLPAPVEATSAAETSPPETRDETAPPEMQRERSSATPGSVASVAGADALQRPEAAPIERIAPEPNVNQPPASVAGDFDEQATLRAAEEGAEIVRPEGPAPAVIPTPGATPAVAGDAGAANPDAPLRPTMSRQRTAAPGAGSATESANVERVRPGMAGPRPPRGAGEPGFGDSDLARTEIPTLERPQLGQPGTGAAGVPAPYRLRGEIERKAATKQFGGNAESERAVELSLKWLAANQTLEGYWDASAHGAGSTRVEDRTFPDVGKYADTGLSGLALLAFLGRGHTLNSGQYRENVERGLRWIVSQQRDDGALGGAAGPTDFAYCHAMAAFALAEAYALSDRSAANWLRLPVQQAIQFTIDAMTTDGGWRYRKGTAEGDMSIFGWQLMAIKSAELGGITIPRPVHDRMIKFLLARGLGRDGGLAGYRPKDPPTASMTAESLYCKQRLGISRDNPACVEAVGFLQRYLPRRTQTNYYYWYYGSLAMRQYGGEEWTSWNDRLRDLLVQDQVQSGALAGTWEPNDDWGRYGGRLYSTALATLCLEVYYRYGEQQ